LHWKKYWKDLWWLPSHDIGHLWSPKCAPVEGWGPLLWGPFLVASFFWRESLVLVSTLQKIW
jgi:hypothetical protein